ncbi:MAG: hypothetical protein GWP08_21015, partial [Nitrospiraceae bacterium]|nr:hypothetical protein [Nitrospiraceae bacterium]
MRIGIIFFLFLAACALVAHAEEGVRLDGTFIQFRDLPWMNEMTAGDWQTDLKALTDAQLNTIV